MAGTSKIVRALKTHECSGKYEGCARTIKPGDYYARYVEFPYEFVDQITVYKQCPQCSISSGYPGAWFQLMRAL